MTTSPQRPAMSLAFTSGLAQPFVPGHAGRRFWVMQKPDNRKLAVVLGRVSSISFNNK